MGWTGVERWRGKTPHATWHVDLLQSEAVGPMRGGAWRIDWKQAGHLSDGKTFPADREAEARAFCAAKRAELPPADWENLSERDIRRPDQAAGQRPPTR